MNTTVKIIIGLIAGIFILCLLSATAGLLLFNTASKTVSQVIQTDQDVTQIAGEIADYDLPAGFGQAYATKVAGFSLVSYTGDDSYSHIFLFQLPAGVHVDQAEIERRFQQASGEPQDQFQKMKVVDRQTGTIRGQSVELVISEGTNHADMPYREVSGIFQGKQGQAAVMISGPIATWDQGMVDSFLASLR